MHCTSPEYTAHSLSAHSYVDEHVAASHTCFVEFACGNCSKLGSKSKLAGCKTVRLTKESCDLTTDDGVSSATEVIKNVIADGFRVEMWASLPCKPWSSWNEFNSWKLGSRFRRRLKLMRDESQIMIDNFILIASCLLYTSPSPRD